MTSNLTHATALEFHRGRRISADCKIIIIIINKNQLAAFKLTLNTDMIIEEVNVTLIYC